MAKLVVVSEGFAGQACELKAERVTIGRLEDNMFQIPEPSVSSHHCEVLLRGDQIIVKDLNSTNGTYINGEQITEAAIKPGHVLRLGQVEIRLENGGPPVPAAPAAPSAAAKKPAVQVAAITQGVKLHDLEPGTRAVSVDTATMFKKKSNKINMVFMMVGIALGLVVVALLIYAIFGF